MADGAVKVELPERKPMFQVQAEMAIARMSLASSALAFFSSLPGGYQLSAEEQAAYDRAMEIVANA